jgi:lipid-A-disaccharide synthase
MQEIKKILPVMLGAARIIFEARPAQFVIAKSSLVQIDIYEELMSKIKGLNIKIVEAKTYDCLNIADFALVTSGTATLETAIMQKPFLVIYKMNILNYLLYRPQVKIPYIGMVNIVAGNKIIPEFVQFKATASRIARATLHLLDNPSELEGMKSRLAKVSSLLGKPGASSRAARIIVDFLNNTK